MNDVCVVPGTTNPDGGITVDAACGMCTDDMTFQPCTGAAITCALGCTTDGGDHCLRIVPSNGVDPSSTSMTDDITISATTTLDVDTGVISGGLTRAAGTGVVDGIAYYQLADGIAVFAFHSFSQTAGELRFRGTRPVVLYAEGEIRIDGIFDISGGCYGADLSCAGPGGQAGSIMGTPATGPGAGGAGARSMTNDDDGGGGGGGGVESGGAGGTAVTAMGGSAGGTCIDPSLVPLRGGGGGGAGGIGSSMFPIGGGGGGAIQLTSQTRIQITGTIRAAGAGGHGGNTAGGSSASAGSGGGGGGGIMLEAPIVDISGAVAANGGGGGGGGNSGVGPGADGDDGSANTSIATGGAGTAMPGPGNGGNGGAGGNAPAPGGDGKNSGGGGGARGAINIRTKQLAGQGTRSPNPTMGTLETR